jgi:outer membrane protein TolC
MFLPALLIAGLVQAAAPHTSDEAAPLTLEEAATLAASQSPAVVRSQAESDRARAQWSIARSRLGPTLTADVGFFGTDDPAGVFRLALQQERFSAVEFFASDPNDAPFTHDWNSAVSAEWTADLFGSRRGEARAAKEAAASSDHGTRRMRDAAAFGAISAFAAARAAEEAIELLTEREADAREDVEIATSLRDQGMVTPADPARSNAALAEVRAELAAYRASLVDARARLATLIGSPAAARPLAPLPPPRSIPEEAAPATRDDVAAADLAARAAYERHRAASASRWPTLLVSGRYELHAEQPGARWGNSASVFGGLRIPIFASGGIDSQIVEARAGMISADASASEVRRAAEKEVLSGRAALAAAEARRAAFQEAEAAARTAREIQQARYREGASRLADLIEAREAELRARLGASAANSERAIAEAYLRLALGVPPGGETR